ncbi:hypothetical protein [Bifidobacterium parmae]|nr:hypothetical protein [Bifidobacterium parmae]
MLVREGLRAENDPWESSGVVEQLREHKRDTAQEEDRPPERAAGETMRGIMHAEALPIGPYHIHDERQARQARAYYEAQDWSGADGWIGFHYRYYTTPYHETRRNAWMNEILDLYGLSDQPRWILRGIELRAKGITLSQDVVFPAAYLLACAESRRRGREESDDEDWDE